MTAASRNRTVQAEKYDLKNLKFVGDFMKREGLSTTTAGEKVGLSQVSVYYWLKKDDARLSSVEKLISACGYKLIVDFSDSEPAAFDYVIESSEGKRLSFLAEALSDVDKADVAKALGYSQTTIYYWLSHDDIFVSYLYRFAEYLGKRLRFTIVKLK